MAAPSRNPAPDLGYYDQYSDPENVNHGEEEEEEEDDEEDDFIPRPRPDTPPPPQASSSSLKRKATEPQQQYGGRQSQQTSSTASLPAHPNANGGYGSTEPASKKLKPDALEPSILCAEPLDEFVLEIADWVHRMSQGRSNVEVEAKLGTLIDTRSQERLNLPVLNETILSPDYPEIRFSSDMTVQQHATYNQSLNSLVQRTGDPNYPNARIRYEHFRLVDTFYNVPGPSGGKVRVSRDEKTGQVKECVQKVRVADLNVYSPKRKMDWRVSVSIETPAKLPPESLQPITTRRKDRLSYSHQAFKIDLTQVTTSPDAGHSQLSHELEIEFSDANELMRCARVRTRGSSGATWSGKEGEAFDELIRVFVNNIRIMVRNAG